MTRRAPPSTGCARHGARRRRSTLVPYAAAAAAALLVAAALLLARPDARRFAERHEVAEVPPSVAPPGAEPAAFDVPAPPPALRNPVPLVAVDARRMEMRSGPVRLILVTPNPAEQRSAKESH
jgi:hypothetical protein